MIVIGLTGEAGSGKSTAAEHLVEHHGFTRLSFAAPLKRILRKMDPMVVGSWREDVPVRLNQAFEVCDNDEALVKKSRYGEEYRRLMKQLATEGIREEDPDFWLRLGLRELKFQHGKYVFDDVRFPNEAAGLKHIIKGRGFTRGILWNISRPGTDRNDGHESEQHAGKLGEDFFLTNDGTLEDLRSQVNKALSETRLKMTIPRKVSI